MKDNPLAGISLIIYRSLTIDNKTIYQVTISRKRTKHVYLVGIRRALKVANWANSLIDGGNGKMRGRYDGWDFKVGQ